MESGRAREVKTFLSSSHRSNVRFVLAFGSGTRTVDSDLRSRYAIALVCVALAALVGVVVRSLARGPQASGERALVGLKEALAPKVQAQWDALKSKDAKSYGELLDEGFLAIEVDGEGTRDRDHAIREVATSPVNDVTLSRLAARALGDDAAMVTYEAFIQFPPSVQVRFLRVYVTEIWVRTSGDWKVLHYQETRVR
jgi:hypothetical protein